MAQSHKSYKNKSNSRSVFAKLFGVRDDLENGELELTNSNRLKVTSHPYFDSISEGEVSGYQVFSKIGYHPAATASETTLWNPGTAYAFASTAISVEALSTNVNDTISGSGTRVVRLEYLDSTYAEKSCLLTLSGTSPVPGPIDFFRVNSFSVISGTKSTGVVSLRLVGGAATVYSQMPIGATRSRNSVYTVPIGKTLFINEVSLGAAYTTAGKSERITFHASIAPDRTVITSGNLFFPQFEVVVVDNTIPCNKKSPMVFPEKTDIKVSVIGESGAQCISEISGYLKTN